MIKSILALAVIALASTSVSYAAPAAPSREGVSTEVRYTSNAGQRKASKPGKIYITRDSSGRVISVKRGF
jgi:hypothetical protein